MSVVRVSPGMVFLVRVSRAEDLIHMLVHHLVKAVGVIWAVRLIRVTRVARMFTESQKPNICFYASNFSGNQG